MKAEFDHRRRGTQEAEWMQHGGLADLPHLPPLTADDNVLVVAAHPDDETLGAGGLIALAAECGATLDVLVATDGEASHPHSRTWTPAALAARRREEVRAAVSLLAPHAKLEFAGLPDGGLAEHGPELRAELRTRLHGRTHVVTPWMHDGHPDHTACAEAARAVVAADDLAIPVWQYPIWGWHWLGPADVRAAPGWHRLELAPHTRRTKERALAAHVSQHTALSPAPGDEAILQAHVLAHFRRSFETFVVAGDAVPAAWFEALYADAADPWDLGGRFYERRKRDLLLAALPRPRFRRAFEPGCATGRITAALAGRCDEVVAWDVAAAAVDQARARMTADAHLEIGSVRFDVGAVPQGWPAGGFDLVVLSEVGYYTADLGLLVRRVLDCLSDDGVLVACHWARPAAHHPSTAHEVHAAFDDVLHNVARHREKDFLLDVWSRSGTSVAEHEGIV